MSLPSGLRGSATWVIFHCFPRNLTESEVAGNQLSTLTSDAGVEEAASSTTEHHVVGLIH